MKLDTRASVRRALALRPDAGRLALAAPLAEQVAAGPLPASEAYDLLVAYLFDTTGGALLATTDDAARWLDGPLFRWIGPGNAVPHDDHLAALIAGPALARGGELSPIVRERRCAPRADDAVAIAIAALPPDAQLATLDQLAADEGPDAAVLALSTVQCGRVLAWSPHLLETPLAAQIVGALLALLSPSRPRPLLALAARALGPIAAARGPLSERVRTAALAGIEAAEYARPASFADEIAAIGKTRRVPDQDRMLALPRRELAEACAYILGFAAPAERDRFAMHRALVLDRQSSAELWVPFVEGLVAAAHVPAVSELAAGLLGDGGASAATALGVAATLPLDPIADELLAQLDDGNAGRRASACAAVELLEHGDVDAALAARLSDPSPDVAAAAARALLARGQRQVLADHAGRERHTVRRAIVRASLGELDVATIGELVRGVLADSEADSAQAGPILRLLADVLLGSADGLEVAANLIDGVPEAAGLLALAAAPEAERDAGVLAPPGPRAHLAGATLRIATSPAHADDELGALALYLLSRMSAGDTTVAEVVADALASTEEQGAQLTAALAELRVSTPATAAALAPLLEPDQPLGQRVLAAAICGRALPAGHPSWTHVRDLLDLGTIARAAAWSALRDRARRGR